jgi:hypothetical protein
MGDEHLCSSLLIDSQILAPYRDAHNGSGLEDDMKKVIAVSCGLLLTAWVMVTWASPAVGVTFEVIGRGTYDAFKVKSDNDFFEFEAEAKPEVDLVVRTHNYEAGGSTGWHTHPGPVFITVIKGELTFYEYDDPTCTGKVVGEGEGYLDTGHGHLARNESEAEAKDVTVIIAPVGLPFRGELNAPGPYCTF